MASRTIKVLATTEDPSSPPRAAGGSVQFLSEVPGFAPRNTVESMLVEGLSHIPNDATWGARHSDNLELSVKEVPRYFLPDGSTNPNAFLEKGTTKLGFVKNEQTLYEKLATSAGGVESERGLKASVASVQETGGKSNRRRSSSVRTVEVRHDSEQLYNDATVDFLSRNDMRDDRAARIERINKFTAFSPKLPNISDAIGAEPILLPDDELLATFRATSLSGIPAHHLGSEYSHHFNVKLSKEEKGLIVFSLIRNNKSQSLRLHITLSNGRLDFQAQEFFLDSLSGQVASCCLAPTERIVASSTMSMQYVQTAKFVSRDLAIHVPETGFKNCIVYRESTASASAVSGAAAASLMEMDADKTLIQRLLQRCGLGYCYSKAPICCGLATCKDSLACCALSYSLLKMVLCCKLPCADETRCVYPCCTMRCFRDLLMGCCCIQMASMTSVRSVAFEADESFELGNKEHASVKKAVQFSPAPPVEEKQSDPAWKMCPIWTCCCCYEFRGGCSCQFCPQTTTEIAGSVSGWAFDEKSDDEVKIEFEFFDMNAETARIKSKGKYLPRPQCIKLNLETNRENIDAVHEKARRFVSLLSAPFSNVLASYDEAKEEENLRKLAASLAAQAAGTPAALLAPAAHKSNLIGAVLGATTATPSK